MSLLEIPDSEFLESIHCMIKKKNTIDKIERKLFIGDNKPAKILEGKVTRPNLYKMLSKELQKWKRLVDRECYSYFRAPKELKNEDIRISHFIYGKRKEIIIIDKDLIDIIRKKRCIKRDIRIDGVGIIYDRNVRKIENKISVEYY